jgi:hypothetical protein
MTVEAEATIAVPPAAGTIPKKQAKARTLANDMTPD